MECDHPEEGVANEGVGTDGGDGKGRQPGDRRVGGESAGSQARAEVAVSDDAELLTALDQRRIGRRRSLRMRLRTRWRPARTKRWVASGGELAAALDRRARSG